MKRKIFSKRQKKNKLGDNAQVAHEKNEKLDEATDGAKGGATYSPASLSRFDENDYERGGSPPAVPAKLNRCEEEDYASEGNLSYSPVSLSRFDENDYERGGSPPAVPAKLNRCKEEDYEFEGKSSYSSDSPSEQNEYAGNKAEDDEGRCSASLNDDLNKASGSKSKLDYDVAMKVIHDCGPEGIFSLMEHNKRPILLIYNDEDGCYHQYNRSDFPTLVAKIVQNTEFEIRMKSSIYNEVFYRLLYNPSLQADYYDFDRQDRYLNVKDCVIDLQEKSSLGHSPSYRFLSVINCNYKEKYAKSKKMPKLFDGMLKRHFPKLEDQKLFLECLAYLISLKHGVKTSFFWIGEAHTGKSTFQNILDDLLGDAVTHLSLKQLASKHGLADIEGARLNICAEVEKTEVKNMDNFKALIGNDVISIEPKFQSLRTMKSRIDILLVGNDFMPLGKGVGEPALYDRIKPIRFLNPYSEEEKIPLFNETLLLEEKEKIFAVIVRVLFDLHERKYKFSHSVLSDKEKLRLLRKNEQLTSVECFIEDCCSTTESEMFFSSREIYKAFETYCTRNGFDLVKKELFFRRLALMNNAKPGRGVERSSGQRCRGYHGICVNLK